MRNGYCIRIATSVNGRFCSLTTDQLAGTRLRIHYSKTDHCVRKGKVIFCFCSEKNSCSKEAWNSLATLNEPPLPCEVNFRDLSKAIQRQWPKLTRPTTTTTPSTATSTTTEVETEISSTTYEETTPASTTVTTTGTETETSSTAGSSSSTVEETMSLSLSPTSTVSSTLATSTWSQTAAEGTTKTPKADIFATSAAATIDTLEKRAATSGITTSRSIFIPTTYTLKFSVATASGERSVHNTDKNKIMKVYGKEAHERLLRRTTFHLFIITFLMNCFLLLQLIIINRLRDYLKYTANMPWKPEKRMHLDVLTPRMISDERTLDLISIREDKPIPMRDSKSDSTQEDILQDTTTSKISIQELTKISSQEKSNVSSQDKSERKRTGSNELIPLSSDDKSDDEDGNIVRRLLESLY
ncbi:hypothetical protein Y032_0024g960 [Ancylostoma ceylanicum]|nr:hypothetical protein Y032_0024g960 [Ancylostoma ceylanicum]